MLEQAEVEGFLQPGYKLGVGTALYQDLPCLQEPGGRLVCPALVKVPVHSDSPGRGWGALSIPVSADWKELEGETRAAGPLRLSLKLQPEPDFCLICNGRAPSAATRNPLCFCLLSSFFSLLQQRHLCCHVHFCSEPLDKAHPDLFFSVKPNSSSPHPPLRYPAHLWPPQERQNSWETIPGRAGQWSPTSEREAKSCSPVL